MLEALLVFVIFSIVAVALGGLFKTSQTGFDYTSTQAFVQRTGTAVTEQMQRELTAAAALQITSCGPQSSAGLSVMYMTPLGSTSCMYQWTYGGDPGPQLYRCTLASWTAGGPCTNTPENLLVIQNARYAPENVVGGLVAQNILFTSVTCLPSGTGSCGDPGRQVVSPLFDFRFDLDLPGVIDSGNPANPGQRFAGSFTTRN